MIPFSRSLPPYLLALTAWILIAGCAHVDRRPAAATPEPATPIDYARRGQVFNAAQWSDTLARWSTMPTTPKSVADQARFPLQKSRTLDLADVKGTTYAYFLVNTLKPALDQFTEGKDRLGFENLGGQAYAQRAGQLDLRALAAYRGATWNTYRQTYQGGLSHADTTRVFDQLRRLHPTSTNESLIRTDLVEALAASHATGSIYDLSALYALTSGIGTRVRFDEANETYHVLYSPLKSENSAFPAGLSFAAAPGRTVREYALPEYLDVLGRNVEATPDPAPVFRALFKTLGDNDAGDWTKLPAADQVLLSTFFAVYTADELSKLYAGGGVANACGLDLGAFTLVAAISHRAGTMIFDGRPVKLGDHPWSPAGADANQLPSGSVRCDDVHRVQRALHLALEKTAPGRATIARITDVIGKSMHKRDVLAGLFAFLSATATDFDARGEAQARPVVVSVKKFMTPLARGFDEVVAFGWAHAAEIMALAGTKAVDQPR